MHRRYLTIIILYLIIVTQKFIVAEEAITRASVQIDFKVLRQKMVKEQIKARGVKDSRLLEAMRKIERHRFVPMIRKK